MKQLMKDMIAGKYSEEQMVDILKKMAIRGETVEEITEVAESMFQHAVKLESLPRGDFMDTCGTGGSGLPRMNISTAVAFVLAACGVKIAKHGNKAASGRCGSFDLLEKLGVNIQLTSAQTVEALKKTGMAFLFAPTFHPAMKIFMPVRKQLGIRTIFNLIGPLVNPVRPRYHLLGTNSTETAEKLIQVLRKLQMKHAIVVVGEDGLDEVTLCGKTFCYELKNGKISTFVFSPEDVGLSREKIFKKIGGGSTEQNAKLFLLLLKGKAPKALQNLLLINCAFGLYVRGKAKNLKEGIRVTQQILQSGKVFKKFLEYKDFSQSFITTSA